MDTVTLLCVNYTIPHLRHLILSQSAKLSHVILNRSYLLGHFYDFRQMLLLLTRNGFHTEHFVQQFVQHFVQYGCKRLLEPLIVIPFSVPIL
jgi:hypothetical protein